MNTLRNDKGFALPFVLILAAIALTITVAMIVMLGRGSFVSGQQKRYRTAVEASRGGMEAMIHVITRRGNIPANFFNGQQIPSINNLNTKLATPNSSWISLDDAITIDPTVDTSYDMRIDLGAYRVYMKIADTVEGNSGADEGLLNKGVVNTGSGEIQVVSVPYLYTIEVLSQSQANPTERSKLSVLYQY
jgi:hypothetical protein